MNNKETSGRNTIIFRSCLVGLFVAAVLMLVMFLLPNPTPTSTHIFFTLIFVIGAVGFLVSAVMFIRTIISSATQWSYLVIALANCLVWTFPIWSVAFVYAVSGP